MDWRLLFEQSKANRGVYREDNLPPEGVGGWPKETWFQNRLRYVREQKRQGISDDAQADIMQRLAGRHKNNRLRTQRTESPAREDRWLRYVKKGDS